MRQTSLAARITLKFEPVTESEMPGFVHCPHLAAPALEIESLSDQANLAQPQRLVIPLGVPQKQLQEEPKETQEPSSAKQGQTAQQE